MAELSDSLTLGEFLVNNFEQSRVQEPLGNSQLVRYTCIAASGKYVAFGANSGGVYCFYGSPLKYIRLLTNKEGPIRMLSFAPDGNQIAAVCGNELIVVWELNLEEQGVSKRYYTSSVLSTGGGVVQSMCWGPKSSKVYAGNDKGRVAVIYLPKLSRKYDPFKHLDEVVFQDQGPVVQLDCVADNQLLVSLWTRCVVLLIAGQRGAEVTQVGKKLSKEGTEQLLAAELYARFLALITMMVLAASWEGSFGACFFPVPGSGVTKLYAARPGGRVWEAGLDGKVVATHKLKDLISVPPSPLLGCSVDPCLKTAVGGYSGPLNIAALHSLGPSCVVAWADAALFVFSFTEQRLIGWYKMEGKISSVCCHGDSVYVVCGDGEGVYHLRYCSLEETLRELSSLGLNGQIIKLCAARASQILLHFYHDQPMKALILQAKDRVTPEQVTEDELSRVVSLLESEDWRIASSQHGIVQSSKMCMDTSAVNRQSFNTREMHSQIDSHLEKKVDLQMESGMEAFLEDLPDVVPNERGMEQRRDLKRDQKVEMGFETSPLSDISALSKTTAEFGNAKDPVQPPTSEAAPVNIEEEEPKVIQERASSDTLRPDMSELEVSMTELTTPLRSWSFKSSEKKGLEFSDFSPVRVVRSKSKAMQRKQSAASQTSSLANSPDVNTPVAVPGRVPSTQEVMSQEVGSAPDATSMLSSSHEMSSIEGSQEMLPTVSLSRASRSHKISSASQEEFSDSQKVLSSSQEVTSSLQEVISSSQEVILSSQEITFSSREVISSLQGVTSSSQEAIASSQEVISSSQGVTSSSQEAIASSQEVISSSQEVQTRTYLEGTSSSGVSSLPTSPHFGVSRSQSKKSGTATAPPHSKATAPPQSAVAAPPHSTVAAPPHSTVAPPPQSTVAVPPQSTVAAPPHSTVAAPPQSAVAVPPQSTVAAPPHSTVAAPPQLTAAAPPQSAVAAPPHSTVAAPPQLTATAPPQSTVTAPPHSTVTAPPHSTVAAPPQSTVAAPPHSEEKAARQKSQESSSEEELPPDPKPGTTSDEAQLNDKGTLLAESQQEPGRDALGVQLSTLKQGGTALLSKVKTLAGKGKDRFASSELGSKMEARLEKPVTKMKEILSTFATPPTLEPHPHTEVMRSESSGQVSGCATTAMINTIEGKSSGEPPVGSSESVEEIDASGGKKADIEQLKEITAIVSDSMSELLLAANLSSAPPLLYRWMDSLLKAYSSHYRRGWGRETVDGRSLDLGKWRKGTDEAGNDSSAQIRSAEDVVSEFGHGKENTDVGDVSASIPTLNVACKMQTEKQEGVEEVDAPKDKHKLAATLLDAKSIHKWFKHTHFGSDLLANMRDLLLLFAQLADFSDQRNPFVKFFQMTSEDILPGLDVFVSLFAVEMDTVLLLDHLTYETLDMRRKCWQAIVNSQQACVTSDDPVLSVIHKDPAQSVEQVQKAMESGSQYFPLYLHRLYKENLAAAILLCAGMVSHVSPWIPAVLCLQSHPLDHLIHVLSTLDTSKLRPLSVYVRALVSKERSVVQDYLPSDSDVLLVLTAAYLRVLARDSEQHGGTPSPGSHLSPWQQDALLQMLTHASLSVPADQKKAFLQLFKREGYWQGCLDLLSPLLKETRDGVNLELYSEAVDIVLRLEDIALLDVYDLNPKSMDEGRALLKLACNAFSSRASQSARKVTTQEHSATPLVPPPTAESPATPTPLDTTPPTHRPCPAADILHRLILHLGSRPGQLLLAELADGGVGYQWLSQSSVLSGLVQLCTLEGEMSAVGHRVLEKVDTYLWSARSNALAPHFAQAYHHCSKQAPPKMEEREGEGASSSAGVQYEAKVELFSHPEATYLEDATSHWGCRVASSNTTCTVCQLSVYSAVSASLPGIIALPCGHCFHKCCLPETACLLCFADSECDV